MSGGRTDEAVAFAWQALLQHRRENGCAACKYTSLAENYWEVVPCAPLDLSLAATAPECTTCAPDSTWFAERGLRLAGLARMSAALGPRKKDPPIEMQHLYCRYGSVI